MDEIELLKRRVEREKAARKKAEEILEKKSLELYSVNQKLKSFNSQLTTTIETQSVQLEESEQKYKTLIDGINDTIYNINKEGYFTYFNANALYLSEYSKEELNKMNFISLIAPDYRAETIAEHIKFISGDDLKVYFEFPIITKSGTKKWIGQNITRIKTAKEEYFTGVARDITVQKESASKILESQLNLEKSEYKYRSIMENMQLGLLEVDTRGYATRIYPLFCKMTGYTEEELLGTRPEELFLDEKNKIIFDRHQKRRADGEASVFEIELIKKDGKKIVVLLSGAPYYDRDNNIIGSIGIHYDITDRKQLEEELKKSKEIAERAQEAQKQFLANMSHEMRTPLNAIIGMSHLLEDTTLDDEQSELLRILKSSGSLLLSLISDVLDMSKIEAGIIEIQQRPFALRRLITEIKSTFLHKIKDHNIELSMFVSDDIHEHLIGDELLLSQVLINLVNNACKFTKQGFVKIELELILDEEKYQHIKFKVSDSGIGIEADKLKSIFDEFVQEDESVKHNYGGTGLGLAISKKLINVLGAEIQAESTKNIGSCFFFTLSLEKNLDIIAQKPFSNPLITTNLNKELRILIVEDNKMNINYISRLMKKWQHNYDIAYNGQEAIDLCQLTQYDIILMDLQMPVMDGITASKIIRAELQSYKDTPIIALTASTLLTKKKLALSAGMTDFIAKPFSPNQLLQVLHQYLGNQEKNQTIIPEEKMENLTKETLDIEYLDSLYEDDKEYKTEMFEIFLDQIDGELTIFNEAYKNGDIVALGKISHKIKPSMAMVGMTKVKSILDDLEKTCKSDDHTAINTIYESFNQEFNSKIGLVKAELSNLRS